MNNKTIFLISGSIAAGKSTIAYNFVNFFHLMDLPYVSTDIYYKVFFENLAEVEFDTKYDMARKFTDRMLEHYINVEQSFVWETVLSKKKKKIFLNKCIDAGYKIICIFVGAPLDCTITRSINRENEGDHHVDVDFLKDRYIKSIDALNWLKELIDVLAIIDNSAQPTLVYYRDRINIYTEENLPEWVKGAI